MDHRPSSTRPDQCFVSLLFRSSAWEPYRSRRGVVGERFQTNFSVPGPPSTMSVSSVSETMRHFRFRVDPGKQVFEPEKTPLGAAKHQRVFLHTPALALFRRIVPDRHAFAVHPAGQHLAICRKRVNVGAALGLVDDPRARHAVLCRRQRGADPDPNDHNQNCDQGRRENERAAEPFYDRSSGGRSRCVS